MRLAWSHWWRIGECCHIHKVTGWAHYSCDSHNMLSADTKHTSRIIWQQNNFPDAASFHEPNIKLVSDLPPHPKCLFLVSHVLVLHPLKYSFTDQYISRVFSADSWTPTACTSALAYDRGGSLWDNFCTFLRLCCENWWWRETSLLVLFFYYYWKVLFEIPKSEYLQEMLSILIPGGVL